MTTVVGFARNRAVRRMNGEQDALLVGELVVEGSAGQAVRANVASFAGKALLGIVARQIEAGQAGGIFVEGECKVRLPGTDAPVAGSRLYLAATAGRASVAPAPTLIAEIGQVTDPSGFSAQNPLVRALLVRRTSISIP